MLKIRRPLGRLIFNMGIAIPGKTVFLIETAPWIPYISTPIGTHSICVILMALRSNYGDWHWLMGNFANDTNTLISPHNSLMVLGNNSNRHGSFAWPTVDMFHNNFLLTTMWFSGCSQIWEVRMALINNFTINVFLTRGLGGGWGGGGGWCLP